MISHAFILTLLLCLVASATAGVGDQPRLATGPIHSGELVIELDLAGAKQFSIAIEAGKGAKIDWIEAVLIGGDGVASALEMIAPAPAKGRHDYDISGKGIGKFTARVRAEHDGEATSRIQFFHDAPRAAVGQKILSLKGDPLQGRDVFARGTCSSCHVFDGRGGRVGPDLSALGDRADLGAIVESLIAPDAALAEGCETNIITTKDGTPHLGFVVADGRESVTIKDSAGHTHEVDKEEIVSRKPQSFSLMPPFGELLSPQQIADLAAFLKAQQK